MIIDYNLDHWGVTAISKSVPYKQPEYDGTTTKRDRRFWHFFLVFSRIPYYSKLYNECTYVIYLAEGTMYLEVRVLAGGELLVH